jgi:HK97 family phage major capsid protein
MNAKELKNLSDERGAKAKELVSLLNEPKLTDEQRTKSTALKAELADIDDRLQRAADAIAISATKPADFTRQEERDVNKFDFAKLLRCMVGDFGVKLDGIEAEMAQEGSNEAKAAGIGAIRGVMLPRSLVRRQDRTARRGYESRAVSMTATGTTSTTGDQGGMTVATVPMGLLDDFYNALVLEKAGITVLEGLVGNVNLPRYSKDTDPAHAAENVAGAQVTPTTAMLSLTPHRLPCYIDLSEQLLMQSSAAIETVVRGNLMQQLAAEVEGKWINGTGANSQPAGILLAASYPMTGQVVYSGGATSNSTNTAGLAQSYLDWVRLRTAVAKYNALRGRPAFVTNSQVVGQAMQTKRGLAIPTDSTATDSRMIIDDIANARVAGFPVFETNNVPATLTKGGSGATLSANIFGNWQDFYGAFWSGINMELVRDATLATTGVYRLVASVYYDGGIVRPVSFAKCIDIAAP